MKICYLEYKNVVSNMKIAPQNNGNGALLRCKVSILMSKLQDKHGKMPLIAQFS